MEDKWKPNDGPVLNLFNNQDAEFIIVAQDEEQEQSNDEQHVGETNDVLIIAPEENMEQNGESGFQSESDLNAENHETTNECTQGSDQNQHLPQIPIHNDTHNLCHMAVNTNNDAVTESDAFPSILVEYPENINHVDAPACEQLPTPSAATEIWPPVSLPNVYYHLPSAVSQDYSCISQSSRRSNGGDSFFDPDHDELLLHSLFKDPGSCHYLGTGQLPRNLSLLDPRQEHLLAPNQVQGWCGNGVVNLAMSAASHHYPGCIQVLIIVQQSFISRGTIVGWGMKYRSGNEGELGWMNL